MTDRAGFSDIYSTVFVGNVQKRMIYNLIYVFQQTVYQCYITGQCIPCCFYSIKQWSVIKEKNFLNKESKVLKNALFELSWRVLNGQMKVESAINTLEDLCVSNVVYSWLHKMNLYGFRLWNKLS